MKPEATKLLRQEIVRTQAENSSLADSRRFSLSQVKNQGARTRETGSQERRG